MISTYYLPVLIHPFISHLSPHKRSYTIWVMSIALSRRFILLKNTLSQFWHPIKIARFYTLTDSFFKLFFSTCISKSCVLQISKQIIICFSWIFRIFYPWSWDTFMENNRNFSNNLSSYDPKAINQQYYSLIIHKNR